jgi:hypothetical protein
MYCVGDAERGDVVPDEMADPRRNVVVANVAVMGWTEVDG